MKTIFGISFRTAGEFEEAVGKCSDCGATHLVITENLPLANWQFDTPGDPYPAWYAHQPGLLKTYPPASILPFVDKEHAARTQEVLKQRCEILRRYNMRGAYFTTEPQILPEKVYDAYPEWRGPRVDQPNRSRVARFAPCIGNSEVLQLYKESLQLLLQACPEIDTLLLMTIDSGSGLCWAPSLYPGPNGCQCCCAEDIDDRAVEFLKTLGDTAKAAGVQLDVDFAEIEPRSWMKKTFLNPKKIVTRLERGLAINNREGPDGNQFASGPFINLFYNAFYPAIGIPRPVDFLRKLSLDKASECQRSILGFNDGLNTELNTTIYKSFDENPGSNHLSRMVLLREVAAGMFGQDSADTVLDMWVAIDDAERQLASLDFGPFILMGGMLARWITRPFVPFPEELDDSEKSGFFPYLFQARDETSALNLIDIQAMRMFEGWGARLLVQQTVEVTLSHLNKARAFAWSLEGSKQAGTHSLIRRLDLLICLLRNANHAVAYQAQLNRMKVNNHLEEINDPLPLGAVAAWDAADLTRIARAEIDNTVAILKLLENSEQPIMHMAMEGDPETIFHFSSKLPDVLRNKVRIMNSKWIDYNRLSLPANP